MTRYRVAPCLGVILGMPRRTSRHHRWQLEIRFYDFEGLAWYRRCTRCGKWYDEAREIVVEKS